MLLHFCFLFFFLMRRRLPRSTRPDTLFPYPPLFRSYFALVGLSALLNTIKAVKARLNPELEVEGLLRTMFDVRNNLGNDVSGQLVAHFGDKVLDRKSTRLNSSH